MENIYVLGKVFLESRGILMHLTFQTAKLAKVMSEEKRLRREYGDECGRRIMRRLAELEAAPNLEALRNLPGPRCHELHGNRKGQLSVDLKHPYRLIFVPAHDPFPVLESAGGGLDWTNVTAVRVVEVADTHE